jgi:pimeloyl-ACP methyl ester carboxylesterase
MTRAEFVELDWCGRSVRIEYERLGGEEPGRPPIVFLHEGLGSLALWKDFPRRLCAAAGTSGLVYSRPGYGRSSARPATERWQPDFMHRQAFEVLPALLRSLRWPEPAWLLGHSDGASIALLYAARFPTAVAGLVLLAPHLFVEQVALAAIRATRKAFLETELRQRLTRYHADVDSAFWGWNDVWLDPSFETWTIEAELSAIGCPVLAIQGRGDEYGTLEQLRRLGQCVPQAELLELADCGHSPHRDQAERVLDTASRFVSRAGRARARASS